MLETSVFDLHLELEINGSLVQQGGCQMMLHQPSALIDQISDFMSFENGDILMTGTPNGVGVVIHGDRFIGRIFSAERLLVEQQWQV